MRKVALVVEDDNTIRSFIKHILSAFHFEVLEADTEKDGFELYQRHNHVIRYLFTDVNLKQGNGEALYHGIRALNATLPVVISSGFYMPDHTLIEKDQHLFFLPKPFSYDSLEETILFSEQYEPMTLTHA